jgi:coenzyme Q-binding protein COQ10
MPRHTEKRYTPDQLFDLVADVGSYQDFLPWVAATRIREDSETEMVADLIVGFKALKETFTSRVKKARPRQIDIDYVDGPLKYLHNHWKFRAVPGGTEVDFCVDFAFRNRIFEALAGQMFDRALRRMIGAFEERAAVLYGEGGSSRSSAQSAA